MIAVDTEKKGFILYFDNYALFAMLPMEQRGLVLTVAMLYAQEVWQDLTFPLERVMDQFPALLPEARMACSFVATAIRRDTRSWLSKRDYRIRKQQERLAAAGARAGGGETDPQRLREDMDRTRRLLEEAKSEDAAG